MAMNISFKDGDIAISDSLDKVELEDFSGLYYLKMYFKDVRENRLTMNILLTKDEIKILKKALRRIKK